MSCGTGLLLSGEGKGTGCVAQVVRYHKPGTNPLALSRPPRKADLLGLLVFLDDATPKVGVGLWLHLKKLSADVLYCSHQTLRNRLIDLHEAGWIDWPEETRKSPCKYGGEFHWRSRVTVQYHDRVGGLVVADWLHQYRHEWRTITITRGLQRVATNYVILDLKKPSVPPQE